MVFRGSWQSLFFNLHDTPYLQNFGSLAKVLNLHDIYRILAVSLFRFTWYLQDLGSLPFPICMIFTGCSQSPVFRFTWYLQDLGSLSYSIYLIFTCSLLVSFLNLQDLFSHLHVSVKKNLLDIYMVFWNHVKVQKSCYIKIYSKFLLIYMLFT